jgi:Fe2+ or Zn2+ uptake regulation protein
MEPMMNDCVQKLREHNLKVTPQRTAIAEALSSYGHLNIDQLYQLLKEQFASLSLATIYKNIHTMMANGFITEVKLPGVKNVYEIKKHQHAHFICSQCHSVTDVTVDFGKECIAHHSIDGFTVNSVELVFNGRCQKCS